LILKALGISFEIEYMISWTHRAHRAHRIYVTHVTHVTDF